MSKRIRAKVRGKKDVIDERDYADIDKDEQKAGIKRRERRWKEIELEIKRQKLLEKKAVVNADKMNPEPNIRQPTALEAAWLRCDYVLYNIMMPPAYALMEWIRINDPEGYKHLYRIFMSKNMMDNIEYYVSYFAQGHTIPKQIPKRDVMMRYAKYKGYETSVKVRRKNEKEYEL